MIFLRWLRKMANKLDEVKNIIKDFVIKSGREIIKEKEDKRQWTLQLKHGEYVIFLLYMKKPPHDNYMLVTVSIKLGGDAPKVLKKIYENPEAKRKFELGLIEKITFPHTAFRLMHNENSKTKELQGYEISRKIFPFDKSFSIKDFDEAIQSVINLFVLSLNFLNALFLSIAPELKKAPPPTGPMYT